ncbi:hypothetical protein [uncultured Microbulbifer sp.]|uniref:hypothetical protein n=1 Tax=uncultured Microbulbifer sp. TaxID=348147 RepID=UPI002616605F|nr:hypothetical protein [uncultured Microbulbifer sp.]
MAALMLSGCVSKVTSIQQDLDSGLEKGEGYLLIGVDTNQQLDEIHISGWRSFILTESDLDKEQNYILFKAPAGEYRVRKVDINYFFGFRLNDDNWGFSVKPGVISYVGDLKVRTNRWSLIGEFELVNESSQALEYLEEKFPHLLSSRRVEYFGPGEDDFFRLAEGLQGGGES